MAYRQTVTITADQTNSGSLYSQDNTQPNYQQQYSLIRAGTAPGLGTRSTYLYIGQTVSADSIIIDESFVGFDVSTLPADAVIKDVKINLNPGTSPVTDFNILAIKYDYGSGAITTGDWLNLITASADNDTYPIIGQKNTVDFPATNGNNLGDTLLMRQAAIDYVQAQVVARGFVRIALVNQLAYDGTLAAGYLNQTDLNPTDGNTQFLAYKTTVTLEIIYETAEVAILNTPKTYNYRVEDSSGNFLTTWTDVVSDPEITQEINTAGSEVRVVLARDPESIGTDIEFNNKVTITVADEEAPGGKILYTGKISQYNPIYEDNKKHLEVTLIGFGSDLQDYIAEFYPDAVNELSYPAVDGVSVTITQLEAPGHWISLRFLADGFTHLKYIHMWYTIFWGQSDFDLCEDVAGLPGDSILGDSQILVTGIDEDNPTSGYNKETYQIPDGIVLEDGKYYHFIVKANSPTYIGDVWTHPTDVSPTTSYLLTTNSGSSWSSGTGELAFALDSADLATTGVYTDREPMEIVRDIIDNYIIRGGSIDYGGSTLEATLTEVSYTFKVATILEIINKVIELCPSGYFWFIDQANNIINVKQTAVTPQHKFVFGKDVAGLTISAINHTIINTVYFTGGETAGVNFFKRYSNEDSVATHGVKTLAVTDNRVTIEATADRIAEKILAEKSYPKLRANVKIVDSSIGGDLKGYDIESINLGDIICFKGIGSTVSSNWDEAIWDTSYWDMNYKDAGSLRLQVGRISYYPGYVLLEAVDLPVNQAKKIVEQENAITNLETTANPDNPA